jgi:cytochrome c oxidase cbb3-type subunit III
MRLAQIIAAIGTTALLGACVTEHAPLEGSAPRAGGRPLAARTSTLQAGTPTARPGVTNPYEGNVHAQREGKRLYGWFNCAGCHGAIGGGAIGPPLADRQWIYGGAPEQIYDSILLGRPNGMPAFRGIPEEAAWKIVAYVQALGGAPGMEEEGAIIADPEDDRTSGATEEEDRKAKEETE